MFAGAAATGTGTSLDRRRRGAAEGRRRGAACRARPPRRCEQRSQFEKKRGAHPQQSQRRAAHAARAHAAPAAQRHDHAQRLHFTIIHSGIPDIDPAQHKLVIHGMVKQPKVFTLDTLLRYPMVTRQHFVECGGNSAPMFSNEPVQANAAGTARPRAPAPNGPACCCRPCSTKSGVDPKAKWMHRRGRRLARAHPQRAAQEGHG